MAELSYSEYLKCKNVCVKVKINKYSGLCSGPLREVRNDISTFLELDFERYQRRNPHEDDSWHLTSLKHLLKCSILSSINYTLNVIAKAHKICGIGRTYLSSILLVPFRSQGDLHAIRDEISKVDKANLLVYIGLLLPRGPARQNRHATQASEEYDLRHPLSLVCRLFALHKLMLSVINFAEELIAEQAVNQASTIPSSLLQDLEPKEIYHGSGSVVIDNFVLTNKHVIEETLSDKTLEILIVNEIIGELRCVVVHCDAANDLALLYCPDLNIRRHVICPLQLSEQGLWASLSVFSFGYPLTHTGKSPLFVPCSVAGLKERFGREPLTVLYGVFNNGNSGSPVFRKTGKEVKVVGVVAQKHKKEILTMEEIEFVEEERSMLQENSATVQQCNSRDQLKTSVLLKMCDAVDGTHCQFGYANMVPGHLVVEFLSDPLVTSIVDSLKGNVENVCFKTQHGVLR